MNEMKIDGLSIIQGQNYTACSITDLTDHLKQLIREELCNICHGKEEAKLGLTRYSFKNTLAEFLKRYKIQSKNIQIGMIGEFIAHLIISKVLTNLSTITILFNKEELSIRKGFDLTYVEVELQTIWYGEVKSGELSAPDTPDIKIQKLIKLSKDGIQDFLKGNRPNLWNSVITDVNLTQAQDHQLKVKQLLDSDLEEIQAGARKNAILISVLFHDVAEKISEDEIKTTLDEIRAEQIFSDAILFCIQKSTYTKIIEFLESLEEE